MHLVCPTGTRKTTHLRAPAHPHPHPPLHLHTPTHTHPHPHAHPYVLSRPPAHLHARRWKRQGDGGGGETAVGGMSDGHGRLLRQCYPPPCPRCASVCAFVRVSPPSFFCPSLSPSLSEDVCVQVDGGVGAQRIATARGKQECSKSAARARQEGSKSAARARRIHTALLLDSYRTHLIPHALDTART